MRRPFVRHVHIDPQAMRVVPLGLRASLLRDFYHVLLTTSWPRFFLFVCGAYFAVDLSFAFIYWFCGGLAPRPASFGDAFFFSVEMLTTGYGSVYANSLFANSVASIEPLIGLIGFALVTGLTFARVSQPTARILFSDSAIITRFDGRPTLMFRMANQRHNMILEAEVHAMLARNEISPEGVAMRRPYDLRLVRGRNALFQLSWTVMHTLADGSPLAGVDAEQLNDSAADYELIVTVMGLDETFHQTVHARHTYRAADIRFNYRFADIINRLDDGRWTIDYARFNELDEENRT